MVSPPSTTDFTPPASPSPESDTAAKAPFKSGFVALLGRPNVGKSTLLNRLVGEPIAITSPVMQTTQLRMKGIVNDPNGQVVFLDTPGFSKPLDPLGQLLVEEAQAGLKEADVLVLVMDATSEPGPGDRWLVEQAKRSERPCVLVLNKLDRLAQNGPLREQRRAQYQDLFAGFSEIPGLEPPRVVQLSAKTGKHCSRLVEKLLPLLPEGPAYFDAETLTDQRLRELSAQILRQQVLLQLHDELPHSVAVVLDSFNESQVPTRIEATLYVDQPSQKGMVIGQGGRQIKALGEKARPRLEQLLQTKVYLGLQVKVRKNWRKDPQFLKQLGLVAR